MRVVVRGKFSGGAAAHLAVREPEPGREPAAARRTAYLSNGVVHRVRPNVRSLRRSGRDWGLDEELRAPMMSYEDTMRAGAHAYADVLAALNAAGFPASFTQTGGMCAALEVQLEAGHTILVTDAEDTLSWCRSDHRGWGVGLYPRGDDWDEPLAYVQVEASDTPALLSAVREVLRPRRA